MLRENELLRQHLSKFHKEQPIISSGPFTSTDRLTSKIFCVCIDMAAFVSPPCHIISQTKTLLIKYTKYNVIEENMP